jgi:perosamine synthetase
MTGERIPVAEPDISSLEIDYVTQAVKSGWVSSLGEYLDTFELEVARFAGVPHAFAVSNGTAALFMSLKAAGVGPGDEVIVPSLTFVATAASVLHVGATPVFVDCNELDGTMCPLAVEQAVTPRTRAVIPVHLYGVPAPMNEIIRIADAHRIVVIEDCAQAHGAKFEGKTVGSIGDLGTFSFYGNKLITTGEGGAIVSRHEEYNERIMMLRDHAMDPDRRYWHTEVGYNFRMTNLQAALGVAQLIRFQELREAKKRLYNWYERHLESVSGLLSLNPNSGSGTAEIWVINLVLNRAAKTSTQAIAAALAELSIDTRPYFNPIHHMPPYKQFRSHNAEGGERLRQTESLAERGLTLPSSTKVTSEQVERICNVIIKTLSH